MATRVKRTIAGLCLCFPPPYYLPAAEARPRPTLEEVGNEKPWHPVAVNYTTAMLNLYIYRNSI